MNASNYVDGFVLAVPTAHREAYRQHALNAARLFRQHGALSLVQCWGDDVPQGQPTSLPMAVKCQADETVVFAWIVWPSKTVRDQGMASVTADPDSPDRTQMPFDAQRVIFGGFTLLVEA